ncbi:unnamed protein product [Phaedon cochleariae]|uniref:Gag protein n=1 Tax=Phaedon cochleariae TaxID=80249 RepID=A0A9N9WZK9_PHACE|nr:unnamed protein product [Phaedon cochleariae]
MEFRRWLQRLEGAFTVFKVTEDLRVPYLLHYIGSKSFEIICDKVSPEDPYQKSFNELIEKMEQFYSPKPLEIAENFRFYQRKQQNGESLQEYAAALQKMSIHCNFGNYLKTALRNQFVFGLSSRRIQARLLESIDLNFDKAVKIATSMELSEKDAIQLHGGPNNSLGYLGSTSRDSKPTHHFKNSRDSTNSNKISNFSRNSNTVECFRCGGGHFATKCKLDKNIQCKGCGVKGHLQKVCFKKTTHTNSVEEILNSTSMILKKHQSLWRIQKLIPMSPPHGDRRGISDCQLN